MDDNRSYLPKAAIIVLGYSNHLKRTMLRLDVKILGLGLVGRSGRICAETYGLVAATIRAFWGHLH